MDNRINQNRISQNRVNKTEFQGVKPKGAADMDKLIKKMVDDLLKRAEREVAEYGEFGKNGMIFEQFHNPDKGLIATDFMIKISKPSNAVEGHEKKRYLELVAYNLPSPYIAEKVIGHGSKEDILNALREEGLCEKIKQEFVELSRDLEDV